MQLSTLLFPFLALAMVTANVLSGREVREPASGHALVLPQRRTIGASGQALIAIDKVSVRVVAGKSRMETTMDVTLRNRGNVPSEASVILPVNEGATLTRFSYGDNPGDFPGLLMGADEARSLYNRIVARAKDPALLEFAGYGAIRTSVFPVPARSATQARLVYEEQASMNDGRYDYILPRSESFDQGTEWSITVEIEPDGTKRPVNVYSPTHDVETRELANGGTSVVLKRHDGGRLNPGHFRLSWNYVGEHPGYMFFACPDNDHPDRGYFLLTYTPKTPLQDIMGVSTKREVTIAIDRSGSMRGNKLEKVKEATRQIIAGLDPGEWFNIITYNEGTDMWQAQPVRKTPETEQTAFAWIDAITARGGTNIYEALQCSLNQPSSKDAMPLVLFLTDGLPTVGQTSERAIVELAEQNNHSRRRIFTIGVGTDLNAALLRRIATHSGGVTTLIRPGEDPEIAIGGLFNRLHGPIASDLMIFELQSLRRVGNMLPKRLPDLYAGTTLSIVGTYYGTEPFRLSLTGRKWPHDGRDARDILETIECNPKTAASIRNDFVPRLWATRQIGVLQEALRDMGITSTDPGKLAADPKTREIAGEIVRLSTQFGIMCDFTSFFADDRDRGLLPDHASPLGGFIGERTGASGFAVESNILSMQEERTLNKLNRHMESLSPNGKADKEASPVYRDHDDLYQIGQESYRYAKGKWRQNRPETTTAADDSTRRTVEIGTPEYDLVVTRLVKENRQAVLAIDGDIELTINNETILIRNRTN